MFDRTSEKGEGFFDYLKGKYITSMARDYDIEEFGTKVGYVLEENAIKVGYVLERIYLWSI